MADSEEILRISVVAPDGIAYSHNATIVAVRAVDGRRTTMYDHPPVVTPLAIGEVRARRTYETNNRAGHIAVDGGYIELSNNEATIIADSAGRACNINVGRAQSAKKRAEQHMQEAKEKHSEREMLETEITLRHAVNRLHVREDYGK